MYYIIILEKLPAFFGYSMHILKFTTKFTKEYIEDRAKDLNVTIPDDYEKISAE